MAFVLATYHFDYIRVIVIISDHPGPSLMLWARPSSIEEGQS